MGKKKVFMCAWCVAGEMASALLAARRRDADGHQHAGGFLIFSGVIRPEARRHHYDLRNHHLHPRK